MVRIHGLIQSRTVNWITKKQPQSDQIIEFIRPSTGNGKQNG